MKIMSIMLAVMAMVNASTPSHFSDEINEKVKDFTDQQIQRQIENDDAGVQNNTNENVNVSTTRMAYLNGNVISAQQDLIAQIEKNNAKKPNITKEKALNDLKNAPINIQNWVIGILGWNPISNNVAATNNNTSSNDDNTKN
jgi:hypothetical protein